jgi:hypothetical protein
MGRLEASEIEAIRERIGKTLTPLGFRSFSDDWGMESAKGRFGLFVLVKKVPYWSPRVVNLYYGSSRYSSQNPRYRLVSISTATPERLDAAMAKLQEKILPYMKQYQKNVKEYDDKMKELKGFAEACGINIISDGWSITGNLGDKHIAIDKRGNDIVVNLTYTAATEEQKSTLKTFLSALALLN